MNSGFSSRLRGVKLLLRFVAMTAVHGVSEDFSAWTHHAMFRMNTGAAGAALTQDIADFPLLLRLDSANFPFSEAKVDGGDIRFSGPGDVNLAYEIERWDPVARKAEVWVRIPLVKAGTDTGSFRMHWGNPVAISASDSKMVFDSTGGFKGVWHLYGGAVRDAVGASDDGDASLSARADGIIAGARSLQGKDSGMLVPDGPGVHPGGALTVSLWINADTWTGKNHRIVQKGDNNIEYSLYQEGDSLIWALGLASGPAVVKTQVPATGGWRHIAGTFDGLTSRLYVDGLQAASLAVTGALVHVSDHLGLGCRLTQNKSHDNFEGRLDEIALASTPRTEDWIRLAYLTQKAQSSIVLPPVPVVPIDTGDTTGDTTVTCVEKFVMPTETSVAEGDLINLEATADCATAYTWSVVSGPAPRLLDPDVKSLRVTAPRVTQNTSVVFRFTATFGPTQRNGTVTVTVRETIPDPLFNMPKIAAWNGKDLLTLRPTILNLTAIKASKAPNLRYVWTLAKVEVDSTLQPDVLILKKAHSSGPLEVNLCLDNGGVVACQMITVPVTLPVGIRAVGPSPDAQGRSVPIWNAAGRRLPSWKSVGSRGCFGKNLGTLPACLSLD